MITLPGATLGMLGGGQLGRMFTVAARTMGYNVIVLDPDPASPAGALATEHLRAGYQDAAALDHLAHACAAVTTEFENVPAETLAALAQHCVVRPGSRAVATAQNRITEKIFLRDHGFATAPFAVVRSEADLDAAWRAIGAPAILKVARFGYDGKGQAVVRNLRAAQAAWESMRREPCVLERRVPLDTEVSVVLARGVDHAMAVYPVSENTHANGILDITVVPARISAARARQAQTVARRIAARLQYVGVLAVEFFISRGKLLVNEIAPRPHNSGHYTIDACVTNQFEQQVRALCGLPLGDTRLLSPVAMVNLLGDLWTPGAPRWDRLLASPRAKLHLYGKLEARPGRKMGHFSCLATTVGKARSEAVALRRALVPRKKKRK
ncbi:MAG TPA: 5-(carboxyamino)imidazole ribonucleotide synthase [Sulfuricaulis sp.]|nr:5-(carboxyamino)imidazole ribonucleotide synthase [Sulfuricaulis sp.]